MVVRIAYTIGRGTGRELGDVFARVISHLAEQNSVSIELHQSPRIYHSYFSLLNDYDSQQAIEDETSKDVEYYERFCKTQAALGTRVTFKTAINAQSLYLVREHLQAIKMECFTQGENAMLLVRDQSQGFYTGSNDHLSEEDVSRSCHFSKSMTGKILRYSIDRARKLWGMDALDSVNMVYKFHLFDGAFSFWAKEWSEAFGVKINFVQPDTANRNLLAFGLRGRQLLIAGNEWGDIMHVILLNMFGKGAQETRCTENVYLHPELHGLSEYQTVHGSADDLEGKGLVNPSATARAAAAILEHYAAVEGLVEAMDHTLLLLKRRGAITADEGGTFSTTQVMYAILESFNRATLPGRTLNSDHPANRTLENGADQSVLGKRTAILVMDFQNDFVTEEGIGSHYRGDMARMEGPKTNIPRVIDFARKQGNEVIFVRFLGDQRYQLPNMRLRDTLLGKRPKCVEGTWGAELHSSIKPDVTERIFNKQAHFDAFLCDGFGQYLAEKDYDHLVFLGVYCDVCLDSTARTGFQKGYYVTIVTDCTTTLHLPFKDSLAYLERLCGAKLITHDEIISV